MRRTGPCLLSGSNTVRVHLVPACEREHAQNLLHCTTVLRSGLAGSDWWSGLRHYGRTDGSQTAETEGDASQQYGGARRGEAEKENNSRREPRANAPVWPHPVRPGQQTSGPQQCVRRFGSCRLNHNRYAPYSTNSTVPIASERRGIARTSRASRATRCAGFPVASPNDLRRETARDDWARVAAAAR